MNDIKNQFRLNSVLVGRFASTFNLRMNLIDFSVVLRPRLLIFILIKLQPLLIQYRVKFLHIYAYDPST